MNPDIEELIKTIEDQMVKNLALDTAETRLYYHLLRHSRLMGKHETLVSVEQLASSINCSKNLVKDRLKSLKQKGVIEIISTGWAGTQLKLFLPEEIPRALSEHTDKQIDIEGIDFYNDPKYRPTIFERENCKCFYCLRSLSYGDYGLDHVNPQVSEGDNSYRNVVAACHTCNSSKGSRTGEEHLRNLYRRGFIGGDELEQALQKIERLRNGALKPILPE